MNILKKFQDVRVFSENNKPSLHKPVLLLFALSQCYHNEKRLISFAVIDQFFTLIFQKLSLSGKSSNSHYPFGKLENDGIWEVTESKFLKRTSVGHLSKKELLDKNICGGFTEEIFQELRNNSCLLITIVDYFLNQYFSQIQRSSLNTMFGFAISNCITKPMAASDLIENYNILSSIKTGERLMEAHKNGYIAYLNSLHNLTASGANALAESQALNCYFTEIYEPFPLIAALHTMLLDTQERVILLTGHAGDGKSTIALDVLKRLRNLPDNECLVKALDEREAVLERNPPVYIVKDMSELTAKQRLDALIQGFNQPGSWLIVSNTGPLINSLAEYSEEFGGPDNIESDILELLDQPYVEGELSSHILTGFTKDLVILNITRLDNVEIGARVLTRMVNHTAWVHCNTCDIEVRCPLRINRAALQKISATVEERVRWVYLYLTAYEQRLTLRQMIAHLALSLTGGMSCEEAKALINSASDVVTQELDGLDRILFSESFFGYQAGKPWPAAENLRAIALVKRSVFGSPTAVDFERQLLITGGLEGLTVPDMLFGVQQRWRKHAIEAAGVRWRFALRRMLYLFGEQSSVVSKGNDKFLSVFLQSPMLKDFDCWQNAKHLTLDSQGQRALTQRCLQVLLEIYSGFSSGQLQSLDGLYLTLRRPDGTAIQPTQLVVAKLDNRDFSLKYDSSQRLPVLSYRQGMVELRLTLPLLDYIHARSIGSLGNRLAPIHLAQLQWFRAELLKISRNSSLGEISLLRSGIDGEVKLYQYVVDEQKQRLEQYS
ncbi:MAG: hypothetical protein K9L60_11600 [Methylovulum sp.]|nr:hypothetical protein [Methylovulum sp.]MCF8000138.1 hypothetical protein [Methylovulum sp.]MCF8008090.1 hypothetical protein [Methylovulum sp.]